MPKHVFKNRQQEVFELLPKGKYYFKILDSDEGPLQQTQKTKGAETLEIRIGIASDKGVLIAAWWERIIFHQSLKWKVDGFVKCINFGAGNLSMDQDCDVVPETVIGCRGSALVEVNSFTDKHGNDRTNNRVQSWCDDKKLEPDLDLRRSVMAEKNPSSQFETSPPNGYQPGDESQQPPPFVPPTDAELSGSNPNW